MDHQEDSYVPVRTRNRLRDRCIRYRGCRQVLQVTVVLINQGLLGGRSSEGHNPLQGLPAAPAPGSRSLNKLVSAPTCSWPHAASSRVRLSVPRIEAVLRTPAPSGSFVNEVKASMAISENDEEARGGGASVGGVVNNEEGVSFSMFSLPANLAVDRSLERNNECRVVTDDRRSRGGGIDWGWYSVERERFGRMQLTKHEDGATRLNMVTSVGRRHQIYLPT